MQQEQIWYFQSHKPTLYTLIYLLTFDLLILDIKNNSVIFLIYLYSTKFSVALKGHVANAFGTDFGLHVQ